MLLNHHINGLLRIVQVKFVILRLLLLRILLVPLVIVIQRMPRTIMVNISPSNVIYGTWTASVLLITPESGTLCDSSRLRSP